MATFNKFNSFIEAVMEGQHDLANDTLKVALSNSAPVATNTQLSDITQISAGNGYTTGGTTIANVTSSQTGGTYTLNGDDVVFTASGGAIATFRYIVVYNDTPTGDLLIGYADIGEAKDITDGNSFTVEFNASGIITAS